MKNKITICLSLFLFVACGNDSGNGADSDAVAEVKTIHGLGECKGANEGVTKLVTSEDAYYTCSDGVWETEGLSDGKSEKEESGQAEKNEIQSSSATSSELMKSSCSSSAEVESCSSSAEYEQSSSSTESPESNAECEGSVYDAVSKTLKDCRDGKIYRTTQIGTQVWMAENLNYESEASIIPSEWKYLTEEEKKIWLKEEGFDQYGLKYKWEDAKKACPVGWHLPRDEEWLTLLTYVGGSYLAGGALRSIDGWRESIPSFDCCGFSARNISGSLMYYHSATTKYHRLKLSYNSQSAPLYEDETSDNDTAYIRCIMDDGTINETPESSASQEGSEYDAENKTLKDLRDGQVYRTVQIGDMVWMAENLNYKTADSKCYDNDIYNCKKYGRLYTKNDYPCPEGWQLANWSQLYKYYSNDALFMDKETAFPDMGHLVKSTTGWIDGNGEDSFGLSVLPAGYCDGYNNSCYGLGQTSIFLASDFWSSGIRFTWNRDDGEYYGKYLANDMVSVRCVMNK